MLLKNTIWLEQIKIIWTATYILFLVIGITTNSFLVIFGIVIYKIHTMFEFKMFGY
jgi:hypothetical protein